MWSALYHLAYTFLVSFLLFTTGHYYKMAGPTELNQFLADPERYVPPQAPRPLPVVELLPKRIVQADIKGREFENLGYCPVTYLDGKLR